MIPPFDGMTLRQAIQWIAEQLAVPKEILMPDQPEPKYLHLRRYSIKDHDYLQTGGITLAYIREGHWYKVGAAFCSHRDVYVKDGVGAKGRAIGRTLAKQRLWTNPCWIHQTDWGWSLIPSRLTNSWGRAWYDTALRKGLGRTWELRPKGHASGWSWCGPHTMGYSTPYFRRDILERLNRGTTKNTVPIPSKYEHRPTGDHFDCVVFDDPVWSPGISKYVIPDLPIPFKPRYLPNDPCVDDETCGYDI